MIWIQYDPEFESRVARVIVLHSFKEIGHGIKSNDYEILREYITSGPVDFSPNYSPKVILQGKEPVPGVNKFIKDKKEQISCIFEHESISSWNDDINI